MSSKDSIINSLLDFLSSGGSRKVFVIRYSQKEVLKVATSAVIQNVMEWDIWQSFSETEEGKLWLAECYNMSDDGKVLVQERLTILNDINDPRLPKKVPNFFTDLKVQNWGVDSQGRVKCCDYGTSLILQDEPWKLKKAMWWSNE